MSHPPPVFGCPGCGGSFVRRKWGPVKQHLTNGDLRNRLCKLGHPKCIVPGHSFEEHEAKRLEEKAAKQEAKRLQRQEERRKPRWDVHDGKLKGGSYTPSVDVMNLRSDPEYSELVVALEKEFDEYPDGHYGVQRAMGTRDDWICWGLELSQHWSRTKLVGEEYQKDIRLHVEVLNKLGDVMDQGYQGSYDYVRALHCIHHDSFVRCHLPSPPLLDLQHAMHLRGDEGAPYKSRMRSFQGHLFRAMGIVKTVKDNPVRTAVETEPSLPEIIPATERRQYRHKAPPDTEARFPPYNRDHFPSYDDSPWWAN